MRKNAVCLFLSCPAAPHRQRASATVSGPLGWRSRRQAIRSIINDGSSTLNGAKTLVIDAGNLKHDSPLRGLTGNAGCFELFNHAPTTSGLVVDFTNSSKVGVISLGLSDVATNKATNGLANAAAIAARPATIIESWEGLPLGPASSRPL